MPKKSKHSKKAHMPAVTKTGGKVKRSKKSKRSKHSKKSKRGGSKHSRK